MLARSDVTTNSAQLRWIVLKDFLSCYCCQSGYATRRSNVNIRIRNVWIIVVDA